MFGARIEIMWEEQLVDPPIHYNRPQRLPVTRSSARVTLKMRKR